MRHEAANKHLGDAFGGLAVGEDIAQLVDRQSLEFQNPAAPGQRIRYPPHEIELLGTRKNKLAVSLPVTVDRHLQMAEQPGRILNLIDQQRGRMAGEKGLRVLLRELRFGRHVETDVPVVRKQSGEQRRLPRLARTGNHHGRKLPSQPPHRVGDVSWVVLVRQFSK